MDGGLNESHCGHNDEAILHIPKRSVSQKAVENNNSEALEWNKNAWSSVMQDIV